MKILVTGAKGFVGRNLCSQLNNIKTGKAKCYGDLQIDEVFEYDLKAPWSNWTHGAPNVILYSTSLA